MGNIKRYVGTFAIVATLFVAQQVFEISEADVNAATSGSGAEDTISAGFKWLLIIVISLFAGRKLLGMFGR